MIFKKSILCVALTCGLSNYAMAGCSGLDDGASAYIDGETLKIIGTNSSEKFTLSLSGDDLTVSRRVGNKTSCDRFYLSQIDVIQASLNSGNDTYNGKDIAVVQKVYGGNGKDTITTGKKNDYIRGGNDNDKIFGNSGNDFIIGDRGNDEIDGGYGNDRISGGDGHDSLFGSYNNDIITGENGGDLIMGGQGSDSLYGGNGNDYIGGGCTLENANGTNIYEQSACNDDDDRADKLYGGDGHDVLSGGAGSDILYGEDGHDYLTGNGGREDRLYGGEGDDALFENGDGNPSNQRWHKAWGNGGDDILVTNGENSNQEGGGGNDVIIALSRNYNAKIHGGKNGDYIWTGDSAPEGTCGKGDDKGMALLNSCEGTTWVKDYQGLLSKVGKKKNFENPYFEAADAAVEMDGSYTGFNNGWRSYDDNKKPSALYGIVSSAVFDRWLRDQSTTPYSYYQWQVPFYVSNGIYGSYTNCLKNNVAYRCKRQIGQHKICYNQSGNTISCD
ncbi:calcium-binding protein [Pseudoalteromonas luteoviolacea]|uniref:Sodium:calcium exchanger n=1 Tax=Pseudoalteromonas luteoviolacea S4054 TaxID=1129367 RepID=A0A0F6A7U9_9GAMM|nr:calcium-binding protein [Pseudoalteromonas luteoviolacea]AOT10435.1 sodium:calcium exchanger [Pseudoalteromonas luteoviolacea]AOT15495.1 sodium:calcium exchanger [Pseudoalteromonas luteoviolacea]AOT20254.1 sodium:calcium exchanger [Pseudoalteromonas luteoviolacea]KKE82203.1 hypothetical protein N479_19560 [Pseudoalteromonas luteoviolacea S4054]KZN69725.1 hypothetical protein N481_21995 [Pseudoalteromonas luteoviolacea S4047-1]